MPSDGNRRSPARSVAVALWIAIKILFVAILGIAAGTGIYYACYYAYTDLYYPTTANSQSVATLQAQLAQANARIDRLSQNQHDDVAQLGQQLTDHAGRLGTLEGEMAMYADSQKAMGTQVSAIATQSAADIAAIRQDAAAAATAQAQTVGALATSQAEGATAVATTQARTDAAVAQFNDGMARLTQETKTLAAELAAAEAAAQSVQETNTAMRAALAMNSLQQWTLWARLQSSRGDIVALRGTLQAFLGQIQTYRGLPGLAQQDLDSVAALVSRALADLDRNPMAVTDDLDALWSRVVVLNSGLLQATPTTAATATPTATP